METWAKMDGQYRTDRTAINGEEEDVYWMDVMIENGWETTMTRAYLGMVINTHLI